MKKTVVFTLILVLSFTVTARTTDNSKSLTSIFFLLLSDDERIEDMSIPITFDIPTGLINIEETISVEQDGIIDLISDFDAFSRDRYTPSVRFEMFNYPSTQSLILDIYKYAIEGSVQEAVPVVINGREYVRVIEIGWYDNPIFSYRTFIDNVGTLSITTTDQVIYESGILLEAIESITYAEGS